MIANLIFQQKLRVPLSALGLSALLAVSACSPKTVTSSSAITGATAGADTAAAATPQAAYQVPLDYYTLDNGLKVVLSPDKTAPIVTIAVYYNIGFRIEPKSRTGFAHLFEHLMFQGSQNQLLRDSAGP